MSPREGQEVSTGKVMDVEVAAGAGGKGFLDRPGVTSHLVHGPAHSGAGGLAGNSEAQPEEPEALESVRGRVGGAGSPREVA